MAAWSCGARSRPKDARARGSTAARPPPRCSASSARSWWISTASTRPSRCSTPTRSATSSTPSPTRRRERASGGRGARGARRHFAPRRRRSRAGATRCAAGPTISATSCSEIEQARLKPGEDEALQLEARRLSQAGALGEQAQRIVDALEGEAGNALGALGVADRALAGLEKVDPAVGWLARDARRRLHQPRRAGPAGVDLRRRGRGGSRAPGRGRAPARPAVQAHGEIRRDARRRAGHARRERRRARSAGHGGRRPPRAGCPARVGASRPSRAAADALSDGATERRDRLARGVNRLLPQLGLPGGKLLVVARTRCRSRSPTGRRAVHFDVQLNVGLEAKPLARVASGGELSRLMLALKVVLARHDAIATLVFDEVDQGIGGEVGRAGGRRAGRGGGAASGAGDHPPAADRRPRRPAPRREQGGPGRHRHQRRPVRSTARTGSARSRGCWETPRATPRGGTRRRCCGRTRRARR